MQIYREMEARARQEFASQAIASTGLRFERTADLRVGFMRDELSLPFPDRAAGDLSVIEELFRAAHEREFGFPGEGELHLVNLRLRALSAAGQVTFSDLLSTASVASRGAGTAPDERGLLWPHVRPG